MRSLLTAMALLALPLAGCVGPGFGAGTVPAACAPGDGWDPYPQDVLFAERSARVINDTLFMQACLVNGKDVAHVEDCDSGPVVQVGVRNATSDELVYADPPRDTLFADVCREETLPANAEWPKGRYDAAWNLRKDACASDELCSRDSLDEGRRVPAGEYVVSIGHVRYVEGWSATLELPGP